MSLARVIALVDDLMTVSRLESAATASGTTVIFPTDEQELKLSIEQVQGQNALLLVGLATSRLPWETLVPFCQSVAAAEGVELRVIAFGPHMDLKLRHQAQEAGIQEVWANSRLMTDLPGLLMG
ncbi:MAG: hypothetical protein ACKVVP_04985 [Chloroflexota bacterium]